MVMSAMFHTEQTLVTRSSILIRPSSLGIQVPANFKLQMEPDSIQVVVSDGTTLLVHGFLLLM